MFESLSDRLTGVLSGLRGKGRLTDADIDATAREIRLALLEADVSLPVVRAFVSRIKERAKGAEVSGALNPAQQVVKIVNEELIGILGGETRQLQFAKTPPTVIMLAGLQGAGKTTLAGKLAKWLRGQGHTPLLVACDLQRPGAVMQLKIVGERAGVSTFAPHPGTAPDAAETDAGPGDPVAVAAAGLAEARAKHFDVVIVDTAGRLGIDEVLMAQAAGIRDAVQPDETLFVLDAMIGQDAVATAEAFGAGIGFTGVVLTKLDGDARGGAALSVREVTGVPIMFASTGEKLEDFDVFHPDRMASRILGHGRRAQSHRAGRAGLRRAESRGGGRQDRLRRADAGGLPRADAGHPQDGAHRQPAGHAARRGQMKDALAAVDDSQLDRVQAIIRGMTPQERADPKIINASRRLRIANGSGVNVSEVNQLVDRFFEARKMMSSMAGKFGMPGAGRKASNRKGGKGKKGKKGGNRGPTPPKVRNPLGAGMPGGFPDLSQMPPGLDELPPGLADFDLSKLKFPGQNRDGPVHALHVRGRVLPGERTRRWWIVDGALSAEPVAGAETVFGADGEAGWIIPGLVDAHCHVGLGVHGATDLDEAIGQAETERDAGALLLRDAGSPVDTRSLDDRDDLPRIIRAGRHIARPKRYIAGPADRHRGRIATARRGRRAGPASATAGSSSSATGSTAGSATWRRCGPTTSSRRPSTPPTPTVPASPPTCSARMRCRA